MANRRYSQFSDRLPGADEPQPAPGNTGTPQPTYESETTANWPGAPGPRGPGVNTVGKPEVKAYAKQDLAGDESMKLGGGGRFAAIEAKAKASGARNPAAVAAAAGMAKYGVKKMTKMAVAGKKRAANGK